MHLKKSKLIEHQVLLVYRVFGKEIKGVTSCDEIAVFVLEIIVVIFLLKNNHIKVL